MNRPARRHALLLSGEPPGEATVDGASSRAMSGAAIVLMACQEPWWVRRLSPSASHKARPTRVNIKRALTDLSELPPAESQTLLVVVSGSLDASGSRLITSDADPDFPEEAGLELEWVRRQLAGRRVEDLAVLFDIENGTVDVAAWAEELARPDGTLLIAARSKGGVGGRILQAFLQAVRGGTASPEGEVDFEALARHLREASIGADVEVRGDARRPLSSSAPWLIDVPGLPGLPPPRTDTSPHELEGRLLPGRILLETKIGEGSFGQVYRGRQIAVNRPVAVKVLAFSDEPEEEQRRFVREIRLLGHLNHPNVVTLHHADITPDGLFFLAMELLEEGTLDRWVARDPGAWPSGRVLELGRGILRGLSASHDKGIVHSDLKPANIGLRREHPEQEVPVPVLLDFGVSRVSHATGPASFGGTPRYMSPEQLRGEKPTASADVFAAALVLFELLTTSAESAGRPRLPIRLRSTFEEAESWNRFFERASAESVETRLPDARAALAYLDELFPRSGVAKPQPPTPRAQLLGRDDELDQLLDFVLFEPLTALIGTSGVGKTTLVRYGLAPRLAEIECVNERYALRPENLQLVLARLSAPVEGPLEVVILDQVERLLARPDDVSALMNRLELCPIGRHVLVVLEESAWGRWESEAGKLAELMAVMRLGPFERSVAAQALAEVLRVPLSSELEQVLDEVVAEDRQRAVRPVHIPVIAEALREPLARGAPIEGCLQGRGLGELLRQQLERVLDRAWTGQRRAKAREMLLELVDESGRRRPRSRAELLVHEADRQHIFQTLTHHGLLVPGDEDDTWELAHDTLVAPIMSWVEVDERPRRQARDAVRFHVHRSGPRQWSLLGPAELSEVKAHPEVVTELDALWEQGGLGPREDHPRPSSLVTRSRRRHVSVRLAVALALLLAVGALSWGSWEWARERTLRAGDVGLVEIALEAFDLDEAGHAQAVSPAALRQLSFHLREQGDPLSIEPGAPVDEGLVADRLGADRVLLQARSGLWALEVRGRHREGRPSCPPTLIRGVKFPGFDSRTHPPKMKLRVPTCQATFAPVVVIPEGKYHSGDGEHFPDLIHRMSTFGIDRTELSFRALRQRYDAVQGLLAHPGPRVKAAPAPAHPHMGKDEHPATGLSWSESREVCEYFGKRLPTFSQAEKAARGGICLLASTDGTCLHPNPNPTRMYFWGNMKAESASNVHIQWNPARDPTYSTIPVDAPGHESPYGVQQLAGNVMEWLADSAESRPNESAVDPVGGDASRAKLVYGGYWRSPHTETLRVGVAERLAAANARSYAGFRCALWPGMQGLAALARRPANTGKRLETND